MAYGQRYDGNVLTPEQLVGRADEANINLYGGEGLCVVPFAVQDIDGFTTVYIYMNSSELVNQLCVAAIAAMPGVITAENPFPFTGKYDVSTARLMAMYASMARGGASIGNYYIVGPEDVNNLLAVDPDTQAMVNNVLNAQGYDASGNNGVPVIVRGHGPFVVPTKNDLGLPASEVVDYNDVPLPNPVPGVTPVVASASDYGSGWWLYGAVVAAGLAAWGIVSMTKKRSGLRA